MLMRPVLYAVHIAKKSASSSQSESRIIVGSICESGDIIAKNREIQVADEGDVVVVQIAGAYSFSMSLNHNCRLRPAEVLINSDGTHRLIRRRETSEDLIITLV